MSNLSTNETGIDLLCPSLRMTMTYVDCLISLFGIIINAICVSVFWHLSNESKTSSNNGNMFRYLFLKSSCDCLQFVVIAFEPAFYCEDCAINEWYMTHLAEIIFYNYLCSVLEMASGMLELAATIDCYALITKSMSKFRSISGFYFILAAILTYTSSSCAYLLLSNTIQKNIDDLTGVISYSLDDSEFSFGVFRQVLNLINILVRDCIVLIAMIFINVLILLALKKSTSRRRLLERNKSKSTLVTSAVNAERQKMIMILMTGLNSFSGHLPFAVYMLPIHGDTYFWNCYVSLMYCFYYFSFVTPAFLYYGFNSAFRRNFAKIMPCFYRTKKRRNETSSKYENTTL